MSDEIDKKLLRLTLTIAGHLSGIKIKHEYLEGKYISLVKNGDELEDDIRDLERRLNTVVYKAVKLTLVTIAGMISTIYAIVRIAEYIGK